VAVGQAATTALVIDRSQGTIRELGGHDTEARVTAFVGEMLLVTNGGGGTTLWSADGSVAPEGSVKHTEAAPGYFYGVVNADLGQSVAVTIEPAGVALTEVVDIATGEVVAQHRFWTDAWFLPWLSREGSAVLGLPLNPREPVDLLDLTTGDRIWSGRLCEVPRSVSLSQRTVMVVADCGRLTDADLGDARTGIIDIDTDELIVDLQQPGVLSAEQLSYGVLGVADSPSEDIAVTSRHTTQEVEFCRVSTGERIGVWKSDLPGARLLFVQLGTDYSTAIVAFHSGHVAVRPRRDCRRRFTRRSALVPQPDPCRIGSVCRREPRLASSRPE
jgi:hypothetical protein